MTPIALAARQVGKVLGRGVPVTVLRGVSLAIASGEFVAITGPSGSGKSTLLYLLGGLGRPTTGQIEILGNGTSDLPDQHLAQLRLAQVGFIFQFHFLLPELTAVENVAAPLILAGQSLRAANERAMKLLQRFDMVARAGHRPGQLSGGEQQRVAIARAMANEPAVLLGDEPTGNLDQTNSMSVYEELRRLNREHGQTIVIVTHDPGLAAMADRRIELVDGRIAS
ncbi:MAG: ABC transporter ATP-binding protein [Candidatus Sericytochromatia bacterium]|nr:ABC transporter ATP-binding protein [Candidatus Sericytochromatia bacterium]